MAHPACKALPLLALLCAASALAQTQLNVVVHDSSGSSIHHLNPASFHLSLDGQPLPITGVEEHTTPTPPIQPFVQPPGTFTDITPVSPNGTVNILILDALNTPAAALPALRRQLQLLIDQPHPPAPLAIFGLANHLILLQSFTTDPGILKAALGHQLIPRTANAAHTTTAARDIQLMQIAANLQQFTVAAKSTDRQFHQQLTLDAIDTLARSLASLPGRKNILWLSTSFPLALTGPNDASTAALLNAAQISLYPINARSLLAQPASGSHTYKFDDTATTELAAMQQLAAATGGTAIETVTTLSAAVAQAIQLGAEDYTLTFSTPATATASSSLQLTLTGPTDNDARLTYPTTALTPVVSAKPTPAEKAYANAVMARGAPAPEDIPFKVRVLPATTTKDATIAPGNQQDTAYIVPGPWQRYAVDFITLADAFALPSGPNGIHIAKIQAIAFVYDTDGRLLNSEGQLATITLTPSQFAERTRAALRFHLIVSAPVPQESYLRLVLQDTDSNRFGVVEIPTSAVSNLPPPSDAASAAAPGD